jgi:hypothetical protein
MTQGKTRRDISDSDRGMQLNLWHWNDTAKSKLCRSVLALEVLTIHPRAACYASRRRAQFITIYSQLRFFTSSTPSQSLSTALINFAPYSARTARLRS